MLQYPPVARARPTAQIVPEFSGKDRFFAVFDEGEKEEKIEELRVELYFQTPIFSGRCEFGMIVRIPLPKTRLPASEEE